jgi:hypothetical protein
MTDLVEQKNHRADARQAGRPVLETARRDRPKAPGRDGSLGIKDRPGWIPPVADLSYMEFPEIRLPDGDLPDMDDVGWILPDTDGVFWERPEDDGPVRNPRSGDADAARDKPGHAGGRVARVRRGDFVQLVRDGVGGFLGVALLLALAWLVLPASSALAGCEATGETADRAVSARREHYEQADSFPDAAETSQALSNCLGSLDRLGVIISPVLVPMPDLGSVTDQICRAARRVVLEKRPPDIPPLPPVTGTRRELRRTDDVLNLREALR